MPLTERIEFIGSSLRVTNCDDTFEDKPVPCGCPPDAENDPGDYPPVSGASICDYANVYTRVSWSILETLKTEITENYSDTLPGWTGAASKTAFLYKMPAYFAVQAPIKMIDEDVHDDFMALNFDLGAPQGSQVWDQVACIFFESLTENYGELIYSNLKQKFHASGLPGYGEIMTCIPLAFMSDTGYQLLVGGLPDSMYGTQKYTDCDDCEETPPPDPETCETCETTTCYALKPTTTNVYFVDGGEVAEFASTGAGMWYPNNNQPIIVDLGSARCISSVAVRMYTPCGTGNTDRSNNVRIEIDDIAVSSFQCSALNTASYADCNSADNATVEFSFLPAISGRYIKLVGNKPRQTIVQINVRLCDI